MKPNIVPPHALFAHSDLGSDAWWSLAKNHRNPLIISKSGQLDCIFLWQCTTSAEHVFIDVYSHTPSIYQQWNAFSRIPDTDIAFFEITLPNDWSGSYVLVSTPDAAPSAQDAVSRRKWWQMQLQHYAQIDPFNTYPAYQAQVARWVNQLHLAASPDLIQAETSSLYSSLQWQSQDLEKTYLVDLFQPLSSTPASALVIFLDGQVWSRHLAILKQLQTLTDQRSITTASYAFLHSIGEQRGQDYGCNDLFSQALVEELIPRLRQHFKAQQRQRIILCGQSLGGLCALHTLLLYPEIFQGVILQSGSYWWSDFSKTQLATSDTPRFIELVQQNQQRILVNTQLSVSVGSYETDMREDSEQLYTQFYSSLQADFHTFTGGHDAVNWQADLLRALQQHLFV